MASKANGSGRPFEGIRVLDCTRVIAGPASTYHLAVLGADVIRIEDPNDPDQSRSTGTDSLFNEMQMGTRYLGQASNKRSVALDLKDEKARAALLGLVKTADVFVQNFRPGAFERLGLGYDDLKAIKPDLIYCSISAFGHTGPRREQTGYDHVICAYSGLAGTGAPGEPVKTLGGPLIDNATGLSASYAIASALFQRSRTGKGQNIDVAMADAAVMLLSSLIPTFTRDALGDGKETRQTTVWHATNTTYATKDGSITIGASTVKQQAKLWMLLGREDLIRTTSAERDEHLDEEKAILSKIIGQKTSREWEDFFQSNGIAASTVRPMSKALADPQTATRSSIHIFESVPGLDGGFGVPMAPFRYAHGGPSIERPPARIGQDTEEVLRSIGLSEQEIADIIGGTVG